ncbi:hypothetical protein [Cystobacter ferrugineus]|uniref:Protein kinase n=1 Tax=Cystobacter ferrugineus TaxID=83449 RepID=A0A1L9AY05_9BACT|nr:hypothetical protein [Cystobacter ferrugineus]OJH34887.1 hypothetical protein BON30_40565 [Cystobacter ferrugineus]
MSDNSDWKGRQIGPYIVGERYLDIPEDEGRLYEAHHTETGEPALVLMPGSGDGWGTRAPWSARTTHFTDPPALVVHAEQSVQAETPSLHELTLGFIRVSGGLASLDARDDAQIRFGRETSLPGARFWKKGRRAAGVGAALVAGFLLLWPRAPDQMKTCPEVNEWIQSTLKEPIVFSDRDDDLPIIGYPMPEKPFKEQATPPCIPVTETEIRGGCWNQHKLDAPCPRGLAEYQGHCYIPVRKKAPEPRSVDP